MKFLLKFKEKSLHKYQEEFPTGRYPWKNTQRDRWKNPWNQHLFKTVFSLKTTVFENVCPHDAWSAVINFQYIDEILSEKPVFDFSQYNDIWFALKKPMKKYPEEFQDKTLEESPKESREEPLKPDYKWLQVLGGILEAITGEIPWIVVKEILRRNSGIINDWSLGQFQEKSL